MEPLFDIPKFENMYHVPNPNELPFIPLTTSIKRPIALWGEI